MTVGPLDIDGIHCYPEGLAELHCIPAPGGAREEIQNAKVGSQAGCISNLSKGNWAVVPSDVGHDMHRW